MKLLITLLGTVLSCMAQAKIPAECEQPCPMSIDPVCANGELLKNSIIKYLFENLFAGNHIILPNHPILHRNIDGLVTKT